MEVKSKLDATFRLQVLKLLGLVLHCATCGNVTTITQMQLPCVNHLNGTHHAELKLEVCTHCWVLFVFIRVWLGCLVPEWRNEYHNVKNPTYFNLLVTCYRTCGAVSNSFTGHNGHDERDCVSNHRRHDCLFNRLLRRRSNKISKLRPAGLYEGYSPVTSEFPAQGPGYRKMFPFHDLIKSILWWLLIIHRHVCISYIRIWVS